jgi:hypothetical protein
MVVRLVFDDLTFAAQILKDLVDELLGVLVDFLAEGARVHRHDTVLEDPHADLVTLGHGSFPSEVPEPESVPPAQIGPVCGRDRGPLRQQRLDPGIHLGQQSLTNFFVRQQVPVSRQNQARHAGDFAEADNAGLHAYTLA